MKKIAAIIGFVMILTSAITSAKDKSFIVDASDVAETGKTILPSAHGAIYVTTPYDTAMAAAFLEKMNIPPQFNGIKGYTNPSDDKLPNASLFVGPIRPATPNPTFSKTVEDHNREKKREKIKALLKDE